MPFVTVAFDGKPSLHPFNNKVNTVAMICWISDADLRANMKTTIANDPKNITLELGIKPVSSSVGRLTPRIKHIAQQTMPHAGRAEHIQRCRVEQP